MSSTLNKKKLNRLLVISHGHPDFSLGGGEIAAYNLFKSINLKDDFEQVNFIARYDGGNGPSGSFTVRRKNEYLWQQSIGNSFLLKAANSHAIWNDFRGLIRVLQPTIVNLHHYVHLGIELFRVIKMENPSIKIILTLHEYMAICHNQGQMIKKQTNKLCFRSSIEDCANCFPEFSKEQFWLRERFIKQHFSYIDHFISPSEFLKQRYVDWGIPEKKISVIENGQTLKKKLAPRFIEKLGKRNRFAFFGQINPFKGIDLLLETLLLLTKAERKKIIVEIHGANFENQNNDFKSKVKKLADELIKEGTIRWAGSYEPEQIGERMLGVDWVIVPSTWWENSPMVIQEAFMHGRPVIAANIGGMCEKVKNEVDGLHFQAGNKLSLMSTLIRAAGMNDDEWLKFYDQIKSPLSNEEIAEQHKLIFLD